MGDILVDRGVYLITSVNSPNHFLKTVGGDDAQPPVDVEQNRNVMHCWKAHHINDDIWTLRRMPLPFGIDTPPCVVLQITNDETLFLSVHLGTITAVQDETNVSLQQVEPNIDIFTIMDEQENLAVTIVPPVPLAGPVVGLPPVPDDDLQQWRFLQMVTGNLDDA